MSQRSRLKLSGATLLFFLSGVSIERSVKKRDLQRKTVNEIRITVYFLGSPATNYLWDKFLLV